MPGKHVHFSPVPVTPSPTWSSSTLPSSSGPATPPALGFGSPYHSVSLPGMPVSLNSYLTPPNKLHHYQYDLRLVPTTMYSPAAVPNDLWDLPASQPPLTTLKIVSHLLPWSIVVSPSSQGGYITIGDVYNALHRALRTNVTSVEFSLAGKLQNTINSAFIARCQLRPSQFNEEHKKGLKRVDFLGTHTNFMGLAQLQGSDDWTLLVA